jgi:hypothetical protein
VRIAEEQAQQLSRVITAVLTDLGHDPPDEHLREVVRSGCSKAAATNEDPDDLERPSGRLRSRFLFVFGD